MMRDALDKIQKLEHRLVTADLERKCLTEKINGIESQNKQVSENVMRMETEVATGMGKAKEEVKGEMRDELKAREDIKDNIAIYGIEEPKGTDIEENRKQEVEKVKKMAAAMEVPMVGEIQIKYRAGKRGGDKPRPLIVKIDDAGTRDAMLAQAKRLARKDEWKRVFIAPDMTWKQREDARREEEKMKEDAAKKTEEALGLGKVGKWLVVGQSGKKWTKWVDGV